MSGHKQPRVYVSLSMGDKSAHGESAPVSIDPVASTGTPVDAGAPVAPAPIQVVTKRAPRPPLSPEHQHDVDERKARNKVGRPRTTTRDALIAAQYAQIAKAAPVVIARLLEGAMDRDDPLHKECLDIVAKRVMPIAFWEGLGKQEFKQDDDKPQAPVITINVGAAKVRPSDDTLDITATE